MNGLIIDNFAGGGGASTGIEAAIGRSVDVAINHDPEAIAMHKANHPDTFHYCQDVWEIDPMEVVRRASIARAGHPNLPVDLAWFSPDCKHFSKAKGGKPREKKIRDLAWVVHRWVKALKPTDQQPRVIMLENVEEFRSWGPLLDDGKPCPLRKGETFAEWAQALRDEGYDVQWRELKACDYGAPTSRKRLFLIARCDGLPIIWPDASHGKGTAQPWRTAADIIDWSIPCPSIFTRTRPLKDATCRRIATGIMRYVVNAERPFIVPVTNTNWAGDKAYSGEKPLPTITTAKGGEFAVTVPTLVQTGYGEREGQAPRVPGIDKPLGTIVAGGGKHALVSACLAPHISTMRNSGKPTTGADEPLHTVVANGAHKFAVAAFLAQHNGGPRNKNIAGHAADKPVSTITGRGTQQQIVTSHLINIKKNCGPVGIDTPLGTFTTKTHFAEVRAFLIKYYGNERDGHSLFDPIGTVTSKDRFGMVTVSIDGTEYAIADIGMRMLSARELYAAQGFPPEYVIDFDWNGKPLTKTAQVRMVGNSVSPPLPAALVRANLPGLCQPERIAA